MMGEKKNVKIKTTVQPVLAVFVCIGTSVRGSLRRLSMKPACNVPSRLPPYLEAPSRATNISFRGHCQGTSRRAAVTSSFFQVVVTGLSIQLVIAAAILIRLHGWMLLYMLRSRCSAVQGFTPTGCLASKLGRPGLASWLPPSIIHPSIHPRAQLVLKPDLSLPLDGGGQPC